VLAEVMPDSKSGTPGASNYKVKGTITWLPANMGKGGALPAEIRLYDRLFTEPQPDAGGRDFLSVLNPKSKEVVQGFVEPSLATAKPDDKFQFERLGYFVADRKDHAPDKPVFNRAVTLKDSWGK
jgi:glutaminyl-tRNA synthetase